jgi:hypothetical protein
MVRVCISAADNLARKSVMRKPAVAIWGRERRQ